MWRRLIAIYQKSTMSLPFTLEVKRKLFHFSLFFLLLLQGFYPAWSQPPSPEETALFREGEVLLEKGDFQKALWRFQQLIRSSPRSSLLDETKFRIAICYTELKRHQDAIRILKELLDRLPPPDRMIQIFTLLGDNHSRLKDRLQALHWYGKGLFLPEQSHDELKRKIRELIDTIESEEELARIETTFRGTYGGGYAKLRWAKIEKARGNHLQAQKILMEIGKDYPSMDYWVQAKELSEEIPFRTRPKYNIGILLPLSGPSKSFGERAWQAIQFAFKEKDRRGEIFSLILRDSKGNPQEAERAVEDLIKGEKVMVILGPLLSLNAERAAKKAQQLKVPMISFSQKEISLEKRDFVFQNSITPLEQVQTLASFGIQELGLRTFGIFYPNSPFGLLFKNLFKQEVTRLGGKVSGILIYQEDQTDFQQEIQWFLKIQNTPKKEALFIPDSHHRVGIILSQMVAHGIKGMTFLGIHTWNGPGLLSIGGRGAEGVIFVDAFSPEDPKVKSFVEGFQKEYRRKPETIEALCYDGAKLLAELILSKSPSTPLEIKEELLRVSNYRGVSGLTGFSENGTTIRKLTLYTVKNGKIAPLSP